MRRFHTYTSVVVTITRFFLFSHSYSVNQIQRNLIFFFLKALFKRLVFNIETEKKIIKKYEIKGVEDKEAF